MFRLDLKSNRINAINQRLNICIRGHPSNFIEMINDHEDYLTQLFLVVCPKPLFQSVNASIYSSESEPTISLIKILYLIGELHKTPRQYSLSER